jgi:DNA repair protein RecO (recombination protein O)
MESFKARGIVLRERASGESDKYVVLLLKGIGKLTVLAKGARKPRSKFLAGTQPFTYADFVIYDGGKFNAMSQIDIIESFYGLRDDYDKLCYANYFLELYDKVLIPGEECDDLLLLLLKALSVLAKDKVPLELAVCAFDLKFLQFSGYGPELDRCSECGASLENVVMFHANGCVCHVCGDDLSNAFVASPGFIKALKYIADANHSNIFSFETGQSTLDKLKQASEIIFSSHVNVRVKSLELISKTTSSRAHLYS